MVGYGLLLILTSIVLGLSADDSVIGIYFTICFAAFGLYFLIKGCISESKAATDDKKTKAAKFVAFDIGAILAIMFLG